MNFFRKEDFYIYLFGSIFLFLKVGIIIVLKEKKVLVNSYY